MTLPDILKNSGSDTVGVNWTEATTMTLDDVYGSDQDRHPHEQEARVWDADDLGLVWDETDLQRIASDLGVSRNPLS